MRFNVFTYWLGFTTGLFAPSCAMICSCLPAICANMDIFSSSRPLPRPTSMLRSKPFANSRGSMATNSPRIRITRSLSWCFCNKCKTPFAKSRHPVSAKTRAIISIFSCAPWIVALTALAVVLCNAFGSNPIDALEKPVR